MADAKPAPLKPLAEAVKEVDPKHKDPNHPFVVYRKYYAGREAEVSYRAFLDAITKAAKAAKKVEDE